MLSKLSNLKSYVLAGLVTLGTITQKTQAHTLNNRTAGDKKLVLTELQKQVNKNKNKAFTIPNLTSPAGNEIPTSTVKYINTKGTDSNTTITYNFPNNRKIIKNNDSIKYVYGDNHLQYTKSNNPEQESIRTVRIKGLPGSILINNITERNNRVKIETGQYDIYISANNTIIVTDKSNTVQHCVLSFGKTFTPSGQYTDNQGFTHITALNKFNTNTSIHNFNIQDFDKLHTNQTVHTIEESAQKLEFEKIDHSNYRNYIDSQYTRPNYFGVHHFLMLKNGTVVGIDLQNGTIIIAKKNGREIIISQKDNEKEYNETIKHFNLGNNTTSVNPTP